MIPLDDRTDAEMKAMYRLRNDADFKLFLGWLSRSRQSILATAEGYQDEQTARFLGGSMALRQVVEKSDPDSLEKICKAREGRRQ